MTKFYHISQINATDPVSAETANKPINQLGKVTRDLQEWFDTAEEGRILQFKDMPMDEAVEAGMPVYWDSVDYCCKPAYLSASLDSVTNDYYLSNPAACIGIVLQKTSSISGDLLLSGLCNVPAVEGRLLEGTGRFYLGAEPGSLTFTPPMNSSPIGVALGPMGPCGNDRFWIYCNPCLTTNFLQHQHYSVDLKTVAGTDTVAGWIGKEPGASGIDDVIGAEYKYNIEADSTLSRLWPPVPLHAVSVTVDWADANETIGGKELTVNKPSSLVKITDTGIYWMASSPSPIHSAYVSGTKEFRITLHFSRVMYANRLATVTSLQPYESHPLKFINCQGVEAATGDLYAQLTLKDDPIQVYETPGWLSHGFDDNYKTILNPAVNAIRFTGSNVLVEDSTPVILDGSTYHTGRMTLTVSPNATDYEIVPQIVKLGAGLEREYHGLTYLGLPAGRASSLNLKFEIPKNYAEAGTPCTLALRLSCLSIVAGNYPAVTVTYKRYGATDTNISSKPSMPLSVVLPQSAAVDSLQEATSQAIVVNPGDTVVVEIARSGVSDGYSADVAFTRINGVLNLGS